MIESLAVQRVEGAGRSGPDRGGPRGVVEQTELSEDFPRRVVLQESGIFDM